MPTALLIDDSLPNFQTHFAQWLSAEDIDHLADNFAQRMDNLKLHLKQTAAQTLYKSDDFISFEKKMSTNTYLKFQEVDKLKKLIQKTEHSNWSDSHRLQFIDNCYQLSLCPPNTGVVNIDFLAGKKAHRREFGGGAGQPLIRALGKLEDRLPTVLDATAGLGGDSFVMASLGFQVTMLERDPFVSALLKDALIRAQKFQLFNQDEESKQIAEILQRLTLITQNSIDYLNEMGQQPKELRPETVYLDPMYPEKKKKSATKKEMAVLQMQVGPDLDSKQLLDAAIQACRFRVVVKRPKGAEPLESKTYRPTTEIVSPNTRYDIYVKKALKTDLKIG